MLQSVLNNILEVQNKEPTLFDTVYDHFKQYIGSLELDETEDFTREALGFKQCIGSLEPN